MLMIRCCHDADDYFHAAAISLIFITPRIDEPLLQPSFFFHALFDIIAAFIAFIITLFAAIRHYWCHMPLIFSFFAPLRCPLLPILMLFHASRHFDYYCHCRHAFIFFWWCWCYRATLLHFADGHLPILFFAERLMRHDADAISDYMLTRHFRHWCAISICRLRRLLMPPARLMLPAPPPILMLRHATMPPFATCYFRLPCRALFKMLYLLPLFSLRHCRHYMIMPMLLYAYWLRFIDCLLLFFSEMLSHVISRRHTDAAYAAHAAFIRHFHYALFRHLLDGAAFALSLPSPLFRQIFYYADYAFFRRWRHDDAIFSLRCWYAMLIYFAIYWFLRCRHADLWCCCHCHCWCCHIELRFFISMPLLFRFRHIALLRRLFRCRHFSWFIFEFRRHFFAAFRHYSPLRDYDARWFAARYCFQLMPTPPLPLFSDAITFLAIITPLTLMPCRWCRCWCAILSDAAAAADAADYFRCHIISLLSPFYALLPMLMPCQIIDTTPCYHYDILCCLMPITRCFRHLRHWCHLPLLPLADAYADAISLIDICCRCRLIWLRRCHAATPLYWCHIFHIFSHYYCR